MATVQQPKRSAHRMSSGKDILSRMLQMEKQSKQQRTSSAIPTAPIHLTADHLSRSIPPRPPSATKSPEALLAAPQSSFRPSHMPRSQTSPILTSKQSPSEVPKPPEKPMLLRISTDIGREVGKTQDICLSPSWSDHGEKARKKEKRRAEKERKEREKKLKYDEERQRSTDLKAGKRLSKRPPPAAMETQKMPTALKRTSWMSILSSQPSSGENTRRSSREERRLSGMSFGSIASKRSSSTPATSTESAPTTAGASQRSQPVVSSSAPKLPSFRWSSSRRNSDDGRNSTSASSDETYEKDLFAFAYRLESSETMLEPERLESPKANQTLEGQSPPKAWKDAPVLNRSATEPTLMSVPYHSVPSRNPPYTFKATSNSPESRKANDDKRFQSEQPSPNHAATNDTSFPKAMHRVLARPSHDGSSYVHKQRMYQQQQSIAGFEDQQAVKDATDLAFELAAKHEASLVQSSITAAEQGQQSRPITPSGVGLPSKDLNSHGKNASISTLYTKQKDRSRSPPLSSPPLKSVHTDSHPLLQPTPQAESNQAKQQTDRDRASLQSPDDAGLVSKSQVPTSSKPDKILGFHRRTKQPPALVSIPYGAERHVEAEHTDPRDLPAVEEPVVKRSKIERLFREPRPAFAKRDRRSSSSSKSTEASPTATPAQTHSRTRTCSSAALNYTVASPLIVSTTKPGSDKTKISNERDFVAEGQQDTNDKHTGSETEPKKSRRFQTRTATEPMPDAKPAVCRATGNAESTASGDLESKVSKKQAHEVIVESETGEGLIRKTSITRPRSNPQLQTQTTATNSLPTLDFLPPLKHQPLAKKERQSPTRPSPADSTTVSISQFQEPTAPMAYEPPYAPDLKLIPRSPLRPPSQFPIPSGNRFNRSATDVGTVAFGKGTLTDGVDAKPVAKLFVICCKCKFWHDLPSRLYEAMALPLELHKAEKGKVAGARLETAVKCPWCEHAMTTRCCQGWTTVVYLHERHH